MYYHKLAALQEKISVHVTRFSEDFTCEFDK